MRPPTETQTLCLRPRWCGYRSYKSNKQSEDRALDVNGKVEVFFGKYAVRLATISAK